MISTDDDEIGSKTPQASRKVAGDSEMQPVQTDREHFQKMVAAVDMTISLMADIDRAIPSWPIE